MHWIISGVLTVLTLFVLLFTAKHNPDTTTSTVVAVIMLWFTLDGIEAFIQKLYKWLKYNDNTKGTL